MKSFFEVMLVVVVGWVFLRWLIGPSAGSPNLGGSLLNGWPYAAPLAPMGPSAMAWAPPYGNDYATYFGLNYGPNSSPDVSFGFQGLGL